MTTALTLIALAAAAGWYIQRLERALTSERSKCDSLETALAAALADRPLAPVLPIRGGAS